MRRLWAVLGLGLLAACSQATGTSTAGLTGAQDLVVADALGPDGALAAVDVAADGTATMTGVPNQFVFVTSVDSDELRVMRMYRPDDLGRQWMPAPNPVEVLTVPVIARPSRLAVDEGLDASGRRVTGAWVYAGRPGAAAISIVGTAAGEQRAVTTSPLPLPAPMTAMAAWMGAGLSKLPATTTLYVATFDGTRGVVYAAQLPTEASALRASMGGDASLLRFAFDVGDESVAALAVLPPLAGRAADGQPFCDVTACLAVATRRAAGTDGRTLLVDPSTLRAVPLDFGGPVRALASAGQAPRLFALLDEERCGGLECAGVVAVDTVSATGAGGFPLARDFTGAPMLPISTEPGLPMGLAVAQGAQLRGTVESTDGGTSGVLASLIGYSLLGVVSASDGRFTFFDGLAASPIDYDARRATVSSASLKVPGALPDGGVSFTGADGGAIGTTTTGTLAEVAPGAWREVSVGVAGSAATPLVVDVSDGYFTSQSLFVVYQGQLPGMVGVPLESADAGVLPVPEAVAQRAAPGDLVAFETGEGETGAPCGAAVVTGVGGAALTVDAMPGSCAAPVRFTVRAAGERPLVVVAGDEGYLGRTAPGQTLTYARRPTFLAEGWDAARPALRVTPGDNLPRVSGAYWELGLDGAYMPYRVSFGSTCPGGQVPGRLVLAQFPTLSRSTGLTYPWSVAGVVPSGNFFYELGLASAFSGEVEQADGLYCYP